MARPSPYPRYTKAKILLKVRGWSYRTAQGTGERPQEAREAKVVVEVQDPSQGPRVMMTVEVQLAAVLAEEEEVLGADDRGKCS